MSNSLAGRTWYRISTAIREMNYAAHVVASPSMPGKSARSGA
jgi:hypothetical protein